MPGLLHKFACKATGGQAAFAPPGARSAYERVVAGKHPKHHKGEAKIFDPCVSSAAVAALARRGGQPTQGPQPS